MEEFFLRKLHGLHEKHTDSLSINWRNKGHLPCWGHPNHAPSWRNMGLFLAQMGTPHHALLSRTLVPLLGTPQPQMICASVGGSPTLFFGIFHFHLLGVAQHCTRNGLTCRNFWAVLYPCAKCPPLGCRDPSHANGVQGGCVHNEIGRATKALLHIHTHCFSTSSNTLSHGLCRGYRSFNDLVTTVKQGVRAGPQKTCS